MPSINAIATVQLADESSHAVRLRIERVRQLQQQHPKKLLNGGLPLPELAGSAWRSSQTQELLTKAQRLLALSEPQSRFLRQVALTIAELDEATAVQGRHIAEAIAYRPQWPAGK
jgi:predicted ATPase with chaperone activity